MAGAAEAARTGGGGKATAAGTTAGTGFGAGAGDGTAAYIASAACPSICLIVRRRLAPVVGGADAGGAGGGIDAGGTAPGTDACWEAGGAGIDAGGVTGADLKAVGAQRRLLLSGCSAGAAGTCRPEAVVVPAPTCAARAGGPTWGSPAISGAPCSMLTVARRAGSCAATCAGRRPHLASCATMTAGGPFGPEAVDAAATIRAASSHSAVLSAAGSRRISTAGDCGGDTSTSVSAAASASSWTTSGDRVISTPGTVSCDAISAAGGANCSGPEAGAESTAASERSSPPRPEAGAAARVDADGKAAAAARTSGPEAGAEATAASEGSSPPRAARRFKVSSSEAGAVAGVGADGKAAAAARTSGPEADAGATAAAARAAGPLGGASMFWPEVGSDWPVNWPEAVAGAGA